MSDVEDVIHGIYAAVNTGDTALLERYVAADYVEHSEGYTGVAAFGQQIAAFRTGFPDLHVTVEEVIAVGDRFASRATITGTHTGELMGMPPTGKTIRCTAVDIGRVQDGKAQERWGGLDTYAMLTQLGMIPTPSSA